MQSIPIKTADEVNDHIESTHFFSSRDSHKAQQKILNAINRTYDKDKHKYQGAEVIKDYLLSYGKEFADAKDKELNFITGRNIYGQINAVINGKINDSDNLQRNIKTYFLEKIGLTVKELDKLKEKLAENIIDNIVKKS